MRKNITPLLLCYLGFIWLQAQTVLVGFETDQVSSATQASFSATTVGAGITGSPLVRGSGLTAIGTATNTFSAGSFNVATLTEALQQHKYFEFSISCLAGHLYTPAQLQFVIRRTATGPQFFQWFFSFDGGNTLYTASPEVFYDGTATNGQRFGPVLLPLVQSLSNRTNSGSITLRLYAWGASSATGTAAFGRLAGNDLEIAGTTTTFGNPTLIPQLPSVSNSPPAAPHIAGLQLQPLCAATTGNTTVPIYIAAFNVTQQTTFQIELSDASGSFTSPTAIGNGLVDPGDTGLITNVLLPSNLPAGNQYRMQVVPATGLGAASVPFEWVTTTPSPTQILATPADASLNLSWQLPQGCWDEVLVLLSETPLQQTPTGDGSAYAATPNYTTAPVVLGNARAVYKGTSMQTTTTGLTNNTAYHITVFTRSNTNWSTATSIQATPQRPIGGWPISQTNTLYHIDFDQSILGVNSGAFQGTGLSNTPMTGQLDSRSWRINGMSDQPITTFGAQLNAGDFARGKSTGGIGTGGLWAFEVQPGNHALGVQPLASDFNPGTITLRLENTSPDTIRNLHIAYTLYVYNDQDRASSWQFSAGPAENLLQNLPEISHATTELRATAPNWEAHQKIVCLPTINWLPNTTFFLQWASADASGTGSRDELAIDDIMVLPRTNQEIIPLPFAIAPFTANYLESLTIGSSSEATIPVQKGIAVAQSIANHGKIHVGATSPGYGALLAQHFIGNGTLHQSVYITGNTQPGAGTWHYLSFPASIPFTALHDGVSLMDLTTADNSPIKEWDAVAGDWIVPPGANFVPAKGYLIYAGTNASGTFLTQTPHTFQLQLPAPPAPSVISNLGYTNSPAFTSINGGAQDGWNLIGNPFTSPYDLYGQPVVTGQLGFAVRRNATNTGFSTYVFTESLADGRYIAPNQAFWVRCTGPTSQPFVFDANRQTIAQSPMRTKTFEEAPALKLAVWNTLGHQDETRLYFREAATTGYDALYDGEKLPNDQGYPNLYTITKGQPLAVNSLGPLLAPTIVELGFDCTRPGPYRMELQRNTAGLPVFLRDKQLETVFEITSAPYTFTHQSTNNPNRFELLFGLHGAAQIPKNEFAIWFDAHQQLHIRAYKEMHEVNLQLSDITGRIIFSGKMQLHNNMGSIQIAGSAGVYIAALLKEDHTGQPEIHKVVKF